MDDSILKGQNHIDSILGDDANYKKDQQDQVSTSWNVLASALTQQSKTGPVDTTSTVTGETH
jgi:hypothetical protein